MKKSIKIYEVVNNGGETVCAFSSMGYAKNYVEEQADPDLFEIVVVELDQEIKKRPTIRSLRLVINELKRLNENYKKQVNELSDKVKSLVCERQEYIDEINKARKFLKDEKERFRVLDERLTEQSTQIHLQKTVIEQQDAKIKKLTIPQN